MAIRFDNTTQALEASLNLRLRRQTLLAGNLANIDTPNYRPADLKFQGFLTKATEEAQTGQDSLEIRQVTEGVQAMDGNGVDLDVELARLSENALRYNTALELIRRKLAITSYAAGMGR
jgi:flagellar basal-body rod protein FlgB